MQTDVLSELARILRSFRLWFIQRAPEKRYFKVLQMAKDFMQFQMGIQRTATVRSDVLYALRASAKEIVQDLHRDRKIRRFSKSAWEWVQKTA